MTDTRPQSAVTWLYDFLLTRGGAEAVTRMVAHGWPHARVRVGAIDRRLAAAEKAGVEAISGRTPHRHPLLRAVQTERIFRRAAARLAGNGTTVFSGMYTPVAALVTEFPKAVYYAHTTPLPFAYDWHEEYLGRLPAGPSRLWFKRFARIRRERFSEALASMRLVIANSQFVAARFAHHLGIEAAVIHPPVDLSGFGPRGDNGEFVLVAGLEPHKRVDLAIRAFSGLPDRNLRIVGDGTQRARLERLASGHSNIVFEGSCGRDRVQRILAHCRASLCLSRDEAFGLAAVESLASGKAVIAVAEGAFPELLADRETGILVPADTGAIRAAVLDMTGERAASMRAACTARAGEFVPVNFFRALADALAGLE